MSKSRWFVRALILVAVAIVLAIKLYFLIFVVDLVVGLYSFVTTSVLFSVLLLAYTRFKDPYIKAQEMVLPTDKPLVSIIVPAKNEEGNIRECVQACIDSTYQNKEIIIVNDGSTDRTTEILDEMRRTSNITVIHMSKSAGKKKAVKAATDIAKGEIFVLTDSDITIAPDAVEKTVEIFQSDRTIGAVTAHGRVRGAAAGSALEKLQDVWYDGQYRIIKGIEGSFASLTCCSGAYTAFKKEAVLPYMDRWANDRFAGVDFKFCTDRLMTSFVLGSGPQVPQTRQQQKEGAQRSVSILQTGDDSMEKMKSMSDPDLEEGEDAPKALWKVLYSPSVRVLIGPPQTFKALIKQQIRWRKSFIRSIFATGGVYWKRPLPAALIYYLQTGLKIIRPLIVINALVLLPLQGDLLSALFYMTGVLFTGMIYGIEFRLRNPGNSQWLYRPVMTLLSTFVFSWLLIYAALTIRKSIWR
jgi:hyaluronan synthase